jgi:hypothetical protein
MMLPYKELTDDQASSRDLHEVAARGTEQSCEEEVPSPELDVVGEMMEKFEECPLDSLIQIIKKYPAHVEKFIDIPFCERLAAILESDQSIDALCILEQLSRIEAVVDLLQTIFTAFLADSLLADQPEIRCAAVAVLDVWILRDPNLVFGQFRGANHCQMLLESGGYAKIEHSLIFLNNLLIKCGPIPFAELVSDDLLRAIVIVCVDIDVVHHQQFFSLLLVVVAIGLARGIADWEILMDYLEGSEAESEDVEDAVNLIMTKINDLDDSME